MLSIFLFITIIIIINVSINYDLLTSLLMEVTAFNEHSYDALHTISIVRGNISQVYNNNTVQLNQTLNVKLAFINHHLNDSIMKEDSTHYTSVVCPIRSPAIVYPESHIGSQFTPLSTVKEHPYSISGILFCQSNNISDTLKNSSINEDLISLKMAIFDNDSCKKFENTLESLKTKFDC